MARFLPSKPYHLSPGTTLRQYEVLGVIGAGGFALTYLAVDTALEREVVVKEYFPNALAHRDADGQTVSPRNEEDYARGLENFFLEAQALAQLQHPHIVEVLAVFQANDTAYMVMPYYRGEDLEAYLRDRAEPLPPADAFALVRPLLEALEYVHGEGLLHRDVKPANVLLAQRGRRRYPLLLDFGGARQFVAGVTQTFDQILSPGYAPFEQYTRTGKQGPWTDVYACGALLYRMTTGAPPPDAAERKGGHPLDLASLDPAFGGVLARALAQEPSDRFDEIEDLVAALQEAAAPPSAAARTIAAPGHGPFTRSASAGASPAHALAGGGVPGGTSFGPPSGRAGDAVGGVASGEEKGRRMGWLAPVLALVVLGLVVGLLWNRFLRAPVLAATTAPELERQVLTVRAGSVIEIADDLLLSDTLTIGSPLTLRGIGDQPPRLRIEGGRSLLRYTADGPLEIDNLHLEYEAGGGANGVEFEGGELILTGSTIRSTLGGAAAEASAGGRGLLVAEGAESVRIVRTHFLDNLTVGMEVAGDADVRLEASGFRGNLVGAVFAGSARGELASNQFADNLRHGLEVRDAATVTLLEDRFERNHLYAVVARHRTNVDGDGLFLSANGYGLVAEDDASVNLRGSRMIGNEFLGAQFAGNAGGVLEGNDIEENVLGGVVVQGTAAPEITGNRFGLNGRFALQTNCVSRLQDNTFLGDGAQLRSCS